MRFGPWTVEDFRDASNAMRDLERILAQVGGAYSVSGITESRTLSNSSTLADVINVLGTLINDLKQNEWGIR